MELGRPPSASCPFLHTSVPVGNTQVQVKVMNIPLSLSLSLIFVLAPFIQNEKYTFADVSLEIMQLQEIT